MGSRNLVMYLPKDEYFTRKKSSYKSLRKRRGPNTFSNEHGAHGSDSQNRHRTNTRPGEGWNKWNLADMYERPWVCPLTQHPACRLRGTNVHLHEQETQP